MALLYVQLNLKAWGLLTHQGIWGSLSHPSSHSERTHEDVEGRDGHECAPAHPSTIHLALHALFSPSLRPEQRQHSCKRDHFCYTAHSSSV